jgi:DNA modification methylase
MQTGFINDLTAREWLFRCKSVMRRSFGTGKYAHKTRRAHNKSCKPPELCKDLTENLSCKGDVVFDPFSGTGGVILGIQMAERQAMGTELSPVQVNCYKDACEEIGNLFGSFNPDAVKVGSFFDLYENCEEPFADMILTDPPWFDLDKRKKSTRWEKGKGNQPRPMEAYGTCNFDTLEEWEEFIDRFAETSKKILKPGKYLAYFMEDAWIDGEYVFLTDISQRIMKKKGLIPQGEWIWYNEARRAMFFGFPRKMITSRTHTSVLFFLNPKEDDDG